MYSLFQILLLLPPMVLACVPSKLGIKGSDSKVKVINGQNAPESGYPFLVSIYDGGKKATICGGSLIAPNLVLTAAHCFENTWFPTFQLAVRIGKWNMAKTEAGEESLSIDRIISHEGYATEEGTTVNDLALVILKEASHFQPISLNQEADQPLANRPLRLAGWGSLDETDPRYIPTLQEVDLLVQTTAKCRMLNSPLAISSQHLCAGYADGVTQKGSCYGDSGGPLFSPGQEPKLFGVVSGAIGCGQVDRPTIFMRVSTFMPWIESKAGDLLKK